LLFENFGFEKTIISMSDYKRRRSDSYNGMQVVPVYNQPRNRYGTSRGTSNSQYYKNGVGNKRYRRSAGPYTVLTSSDRHTNPSYPKPEVKLIDINAAGTAYNGSSVQNIPQTGIVVLLNALPQGVSNGSRLGSQVATKSCAYRFELDLPALDTNRVPTSGRVMLIWDKQPNNSAATYSTIFTAINYLSFMTPGNADRFVILRNQQFSLSPNGDQVLFFEGYCKINMRTTYTFDAGSNPQSGALLLVYIGDQATAANQPTINGCWRTRYMDN